MISVAYNSYCKLLMKTSFIKKGPDSFGFKINEQTLVYVSDISL